MSAVMQVKGRIDISDQVVRETQDIPALKGAVLAMKTADGATVNLPRDVQEMLLHALESVARHGEVSIGQTPAELTSTVAADMLGISRPTLMKWVRDKKISSFAVGTHTRFSRDEVLKVKKLRAKERRAAFDELLALDAENEEFLDN
ncbi:helix-turn-helix domain-containing protein [Brevibacterium sp. JSBI002]|uniref:helix-turn-helix domain-containing protein n=1 Tax=Brevibacterium sp. JSBI002 TaxID=2886045 RepID=UPI00222E6BEE|nr:helix-turn-helix domain-containing protein [Brevibacterium sp. JSBI002]UZD63599.1 helix-turn-helix domain-containing protein [Brevibacterium sp. JSBI002]